MIKKGDKINFTRTDGTKTEGTVDKISGQWVKVSWYEKGKKIIKLLSIHSNDFEKVNDVQAIAKPQKKKHLWFTVFFIVLAAIFLTTVIYFSKTFQI
jgi:hypothetical protein